MMLGACLPSGGVALEGAASLSCSPLVLPVPGVCVGVQHTVDSEDVLVLDMVLSIEREAAANPPILSRTTVAQKGGLI